METERLTKRETQIMNVLWSSDEPLSAHDILVLAPELSRNTIQIVLKNFKPLDLSKLRDLAITKTH